MVDNIGMPVSGINMTYNNTGTIGTQDGDIQITLKRGPPPDRRLRPHAARASCRARFPGIDLLLPAGRHRQPDPEFRRAGADRRAGPRRRTSTANFAYAQQAAAPAAARFPAWSTRASSSRSARPGFNVDVDRTRAQYVGLTERDVTNSLVVNLAGSQPGRADLLAQSRTTA